MLEPMDCLRDGVPLCLVMDLLDDAGPDAHRLYATEAADVTWVHPIVHGHPDDHACEVVTAAG